ncbi:unnamed protein product [Ilex paraguariensis]|uniref:Uncharacterized protein n=1 Tax=Ilex paraguariensis TaxID=185542 RepID=A0ABC8RVA6_9AQUA
MFFDQKNLQNKIHILKNLKTKLSSTTQTPPAIHLHHPALVPPVAPLPPSTNQNQEPTYQHTQHQQKLAHKSTHTQPHTNTNNPTSLVASISFSQIFSSLLHYTYELLTGTDTTKITCS